MYSLEEIAYSFINRFRFSFVLSMSYVISLRTSLVLGWKLRDEGLDSRSHHTIFCMEADKYKIVRRCPKCDVTLPQHLPSGSLPLLIGSVGVPTRLGGGGRATQTRSDREENDYCVKRTARQWGNWPKF